MGHARLAWLALWACSGNSLTGVRDKSAPAEQSLIEADTSDEAVDILRDQLPSDHQVLFVVRAEPAGSVWESVLRRAAASVAGQASDGTDHGTSHRCRSSPEWMAAIDK